MIKAEPKTASKTKIQTGSLKSFVLGIFRRSRPRIMKPNIPIKATVVVAQLTRMDVNKEKAISKEPRI